MLQKIFKFATTRNTKQKHQKYHNPKGPLNKGQQILNISKEVQQT